MEKYKLVDLDLDPSKNFGCSTAIEFDLGTIENEKEGPIHLKNHILCQQPFSLYPSIDKENINDTERESIQWAQDIKLIKKGEKYYEKFCKSKFASLSAHFIPDMKLKDSKAYLYITMFIFAFDDVLDNMSNYLPEHGSLDYNKLITVVQSFVDILSGKYKCIDAVPHLAFPLYEPLCRALFAVEQLTTARHMDTFYFIESLDNYLKAVVWEYTEHDNIVESQETYMFRRRHTIAFPSTLELVFLMCHVKLDREKRTNLVVKRFLEASYNILALTNDIFSLRKELESNELENLVIIKQKECGLQEAFDDVMQFLNNEITESIRLSNRLKKIFHDDNNICKFVKTVQNYLDGHLYWYGDSARYGDPHFKVKRVIPM
jgi:Terpene synthase family 2, C-terminal metal binding